MNTPPTTLVTAAAGKTGRHTALDLLSRGLPVRALKGPAGAAQRGEPAV